ncbi:hypothetical protein HNQ93_000103 [Hymenobacter luteus]|uniref:Uncharacterized protein n=2 Tax=Hymenobacter TaxID=89966 RepID=A0A7W9SYF3_9BACT|nr:MULTISPECIES: hypothetical protein [Hymenobacter]MBB4600417.1 hypothetical protein [Hymenobacter latericoloratus]MBB6057273.1 hypothetical protein [Hymenobacter luteus]
MKTIVLQLPDSVQLSEEQLQELLLQKLAESTSTVPPGDSTAVRVPSQDAAEIRHLIGLYYAEKATAAMDALWDEKGWSAETMEQWLIETMRSSKRKAS